MTLPKDVEDRLNKFAFETPHDIYYSGDYLHIRDIKTFLSQELTLAEQRGAEKERERIQTKIENMKEPEPVKFELAKIANNFLDDIIKEIRKE